VVGRVVHRVDADGVDAQFLELGDVALARRGVGDGVRGFGGASGLVVDAADIEALVAGEEGCGGGK
jgi:hypothetical protein